MQCKPNNIIIASILESNNDSSKKRQASGHEGSDKHGGSHITGDNNNTSSNHMDTMASQLDSLPLTASVANNQSTAVATTYQQFQQHQNNQSLAGNDVVETLWKYPPQPGGSHYRRTDYE